LTRGEIPLDATTSDATTSIVSPKAAGMRADRGISLLCPELSRRQVQKLCERGRVLAEGRPLSKSDLLRLGDRITVQIDSRPFATPNPAGLLLVRFESRQWVILAKPAGQPTAPKDSTEIGALANALLARYPELARIGHDAREPGLLHRLDNGTSGLVVAARTAEGFLAASSALSQGKWLKRYLALVGATDLPAAGIIGGQLAQDRRHPERVRLVDEVTLTPTGAEAVWDANGTYELVKGQRHQTRFLVRRRLATVTLVEVAIGAAFRHQIRAHFAAAAWPLVNDEVYGARAEPRLPAQRHALHAARVAWSGTDDLEGFDVEETPPDDLMDLVVDAP
jgi:23S rRNA pseudouridine1911/1915/1917 synthase